MTGSQRTDIRPLSFGVGERAPLLGAPRAATIVAESHLLTYAISLDALRRLGDRRPSLAASMRAQVEQRYKPSTAVTEVTTGT